jgi:hypothetical protein
MIPVTEASPMASRRNGATRCPACKITPLLLIVIIIFIGDAHDCFVKPLGQPIAYPRRLVSRERYVDSNPIIAIHHEIDHRGHAIVFADLIEPDHAGHQSNCPLETRTNPPRCIE